MGVIAIVRISSSHKAGRGVCRSFLPCTPNAPACSALFSSPGPNYTPATRTRRFTQSHYYALETARSTSALQLGDVVTMPSIKETSDPVIRTASPAPLAQDFARQQVSKQQRSNFHSSSISPLLATMAPPAVNKTNLHPSGLKYVPVDSEMEQLLTCSLPDRRRATQKLKRSFTTRHTSTMTV
jgi:phosphoenolpyruvate carboxykinase (ATP)